MKPASHTPEVPANAPQAWPICYSAQLHEAYDKYVRKWGAEIDFPTFVRLYGHRHEDRRIKIPRAVDRLFGNPATDDDRFVRILPKSLLWRTTAEMDSGKTGAEYERALLEVSRKRAGKN